ncbi:MAG: 30S ribosomal protein S12 methylthiotransferase RimO [bacterium]|nr:30S ribosomal protein S12 methylthiotransferase RimO [bacterium]
MNKNVQVITLGCPKNDVDTEVINKILTESGRNIQTGPDNADTIVINTCGFINDAVIESKEKILEAVERKKNGEITRIYVAGCLVKRFQDELRKEFEEVDEFFSVTDFLEMRKYFNVQCSRSSILSRYTLENKPYAYLKISEGCNYACTFCIIPDIRGQMESRGLKSLISEAAELADNGVKELILISEDITKYGQDLEKGNDLNILLKELVKISGIEWIRLLYAYPTWISDGLLDTIASNSKICNYIDMPVQHISDKILKLMNRTYHKRHLEELIEKIRKRVPGIALRTTVIVGFPGETQKEFIELSDFLYKYEFERLGVFEYSDEPGSKAAYLPDKVDRETISERFDELRLNQELIYDKLNEGLIGKKMDVIIDSRDEASDSFLGRTFMDSPGIDLQVRTGKQVQVGQIERLLIKESDTFELTGI